MEAKLSHNKNACLMFHDTKLDEVDHAIGDLPTSHPLGI
jgi:hypothetical protein